MYPQWLIGQFKEKYNEKQINEFVFVIIVTSIYFSFANAHVNLIQPSGGETFIAGTAMHIEWFPQIDHGDNSWELYFQPDEGATWDTIAINIPKNILNYNWQIPATAITGQGKSG